ncbi:hypothetical protein Tco_0394362 [Tanacetum coccineum]
MSEAENHPPASSVTALRIPIIKKGEYDLWCMKMRQYIAITDHILWDIITNGDQATTEPASSSGQPSAPKTSIVVNARRNNEKALNILLSAIPDRHLLSFHDAQHAKINKWLIPKGTDTPYLLDGYGVMVFRTTLFDVIRRIARAGFGTISELNCPEVKY